MEKKGRIKIEILKSGSYLPKNKVNNEELEKKWNTLLKEALNRIHAPKEEFDRLGLK